MLVTIISALLAAALALVGAQAPPARPSAADAPSASPVATVLAPGDSLVVAGAEIFDRVPYLPVTVNGAGPFPFVLDTGAGGSSAVDSGLADSLRLAAEPLMQGGGAGEETVPFGRLDSVDLALSGLSFGRGPALTIPLHRLDPHWGKRKDGLIGGDLLSRHLTRIDYERKRVMLLAADSIPPGMAGVRIPLQVQNGFLFVEAKVLTYGADQPIDAVFLVDTGVRVTVFNGPYARLHGLAAQSPRTITGITGFGIGGASRGIVGRVREIRLGALTISNPVVSFSLDESGALADTDFSGILGADILSRCDVVLDYAGARMLLRPNRSFEEPSESDMSGIRFVMEGQRFDRLKVLFVFEGSPASEAGILAGDVVTEIDGRSGDAFTRETLRDYMQREGAEVRLAINRDGAKREVRLRLRRLV